MVYEQCGGAGDALLWKNETAKPEKMARVEQFRPRMCLEAVRTVGIASGVSVPDLPREVEGTRRHRCRVAEEILSDDTDDADAIADALLFKISNGEAFASDLADEHHGHRQS
ncbi:hypothetical protein [Caballeronia sp. INDeC2]|uniref:hypothetical protein n=1 Tax=Caballeronia sp. INDeC2 TaxID=2921747 RepID=UPI0020298CB7|nr:hypothetical protein [Caballeronia sp. INDeC2]